MWGSRRTDHTMTRHAASPRFETLAAEWPKFTAPLLLVPGLWCRPAAWHRCMGYFAHRGWTCHALDPGGATRAASIAEWQAAVREAVRNCDAPPVLVGHDLGGWLVLDDTMAEVRAVVALAPLVPRVLSGGHPAMTRWAVWWALRRGMRDSAARRCTGRAILRGRCARRERSGSSRRIARPIPVAAAVEVSPPACTRRGGRTRRGLPAGRGCDVRAVARRRVPRRSGRRPRAAVGVRMGGPGPRRPSLARAIVGRAVARNAR